MGPVPLWCRALFHQMAPFSNPALSLALAGPEAKTADQRTKGGHAGGHNRGVAGLGKLGAGLCGGAVGPAMLPAVMTLTANMALTGVLLLILPNAKGSVNGTWVSVPLSQIIAMLLSLLLIHKNRTLEHQLPL